MNEPQQQSAITFPVLIPPELAAVTENLIRLKETLETEIVLMRETRGQISFTELELAEYFGISLISMERIRRDGKIAYTRVAGKIHYRRKHIDEYLDREETKSKNGKATKK